MKIIHKYSDFLEIVDPLRCDDFDDLEIKPCFDSGLFTWNRYHELVEFCQKNPSYHIISEVGPGVDINKPLEGMCSYRLGKGDKDPELAYVKKIDWKDYECLKMFEFNADKI